MTTFSSAKLLELQKAINNGKVIQFETEFLDDGERITRVEYQNDNLNFSNEEKKLHESLVMKDQIKKEKITEPLNYDPNWVGFETYLKYYPTFTDLLNNLPLYSDEEVVHSLLMYWLYKSHNYEHGLDLSDRIDFSLVNFKLMIWKNIFTNSSTILVINAWLDAIKAMYDHLVKVTGTAVINVNKKKSRKRSRKNRT